MKGTKDAAMRDFSEAVTSYVAGISGAVLSHLQWSDIGSLVMGFGSFVLLAARLVVDVPRALDSLKKRRNRG